MYGKLTGGGGVHHLEVDGRCNWPSGSRTFEIGCPLTGGCPAVVKLDTIVKMQSSDEL